jgi:hypothetical protein
MGEAGKGRHSLRVFENRVLKIFRPKRDEVTGGWRKLHKEFHNVSSSLNVVRIIKSRRIGWAGHAAHMREMRNAYKILVGKPEGRRQLGRPRCRWEVYSKMDHNRVGSCGQESCGSG